MFDFNEHAKDSKFYNESNKTVIGKMEDEMKGVPFVPL